MIENDLKVVLIVAICCRTSMLKVLILKSIVIYDIIIVICKLFENLINDEYDILCYKGAVESDKC